MRWFHDLSISSKLLVVCLLFCFFVARAISKPLGQAVRVANRLAEGDFTVHISSDARDETGRLLMALERMVRKLAQVIPRYTREPTRWPRRRHRCRSPRITWRREPASRPAAWRRPPPAWSR
ncbi:methyl-accepting chemotaxis protein [Cystobacter fuscus]|nr:methyl-accepting chemotaxis protein [Cystobacter fuscus]